MIIRIIKDFFYALRSIKVNEKFCLNNISLKTGCTKCIDICPNNAIDFKDNKLLLESNCDECGICAGVCPNGTISLQEPTEEQIFKALLEGETLSCRKHNEKTTLKINCLACLTQDLIYGLYILGLDRLIMNDINECNNCNYYEVMKNTYFKYKINSKKLNNSLLLNVNPIDFKYVSLKKQYDEEKRKLLESSFIYTRNLYMDYLNKYIHVDNKLSEKEYIGNKFVKSALDLLDLDTDLEIYIENIRIPSISNPCRFCTACEKLCPSQSIKIESKEGKKYLILDTSSCINCSLCINICQYKSLQYKKVKISDLFNNRKIITEIEGK